MVFFFFVFIRSVVRLLTLVSDSLRLRSVSFPLQNSVHMRILGFRRWVIFELLIYVVFGCGENYGKKGKEKERKEKNYFLNFFLFGGVGVVDSIREIRWGKDMGVLCSKSRKNMMGLETELIFFLFFLHFAEANHT